ncbi:MAG: GntR family transcriptional regulator [Armatimonas sp.]
MPSPQTKQEAAIERLSALARQLGPGAQLPKFSELLTDLSVSRTTLGAVLTALESQGIITRKHGVGIYVSPQLNRRNIVLLCAADFFRTDDASPFWKILTDKARTRASEKSEDFTLHFTRADDVYYSDTPSLSDSLEAEIQAGHVSGILGVGVNIATSRWIEAQKIPFVAFAGYGTYMVSFDMVASVRMGVEALAARGCRRIGYWSPVTGHASECRKSVLCNPAIMTFQSALQALDLPFEPELVHTNAYLCPEDVTERTEPWPVPSLQEQGHMVAGTVFGPDSDPRQRPDGIVCTDDCMMQGALPQLIRLGIRIGSDVQIATHTNAGSPVLYGYEDLLIRMEADAERLIGEMYSRLEAQFEGHSLEVPRLCLPPTLYTPNQR